MLPLAISRAAEFYRSQAKTVFNRNAVLHFRKSISISDIFMTSAQNDPPRKKPIELDAALLQFLAACFGFGFFLLGYSYTHSFFRSFGLSIFDIDVDWLDIVFRGIALLEKGQVWAACLALVVLLALLWEIRAIMGGMIGALISLLIAISVVTGALLGGKYMGQENAKAIWGEGAGRMVWCRFTKEMENDQPAFTARLYDLAKQERLRHLHANTRNVYLAPVLEIIPKGQAVGESYAISKNNIEYCRVVGSQSEPGFLPVGS